MEISSNDYKNIYNIVYHETKNVSECEIHWIPLSRIGLARIVFQKGYEILSQYEYSMPLNH